VNDNCELIEGPCTCGAWHDKKELLHIINMKEDKIIKKYLYSFMSKRAFLRIWKDTPMEMKKELQPLFKRHLQIYREMKNELDGKQV